MHESTEECKKILLIPYLRELAQRLSAVVDHQELVTEEVQAALNGLERLNLRFCAVHENKIILGVLLKEAEVPVSERDRLLTHDLSQPASSAVLQVFRVLAYRLAAQSEHWSGKRAPRLEDWAQRPILRQMLGISYLLYVRACLLTILQVEESVTIVVHEVLDRIPAPDPTKLN